MLLDVESLYAALVQRADRYGIVVRQADLNDEMPGEFDGLTITLNNDYDPAERAFYLAHSIGSIAEWSIHPKRSGQVFHQLGIAKRHATSDAAGLESAIAAYLAFETTTWEFAVWLLADTGNDHFVSTFTNFGRADMEAMRLLHTTGTAPVWRKFFANWNHQVRQGTRTLQPFTARSIPKFRAIGIPKQEIVQNEGDEKTDSSA